MVTVSRIDTPRVTKGKREFAETERALRLGVEKFLGVPMVAWSRLLVLFLALVGIKLALIVRLGKQLFEAHWRLTPHEPVWGDYVLFGFFVAIGFLSVWRLQRECALAGIMATRAANGIVLGLGLLFIFFTFQAQGKNYLFPILGGVLNWDSLIPYLSLNLFFQSPYLGAWIFAYALSYYVLVRNGRESLVLYLTAVFAAAYAAVGLRELAISRSELLVVSGLGVASLAIGQYRNGIVRALWLLAPLIWCLLFVMELFWLVPGHLGLPFTYFWLLVYASALLFGGATLLAYRRGFGAGWSRSALFYFSGFLLLANRNYPGAAHLNNALCLGLQFPRYFAGEVLIVGMLALLAAAHKLLFPRIRFWWLDVVSIAFIAIAFVDLRVTQIMGTRLGWDVLAMGGNAKMMWRMSKPYLPGAIGGVVLLAGIYAIALRVAHSWLYGRSMQANGNEGKTAKAVEIASEDFTTSLKRRVNERGIVYAAIAFLLLGLIGLVTANADKAQGQSSLRLVETSRIWKRATNRILKPEEFVRAARSLGLGDLNAAGATPNSPSADLNVVLVFMESTYNKHLSLFGCSEETQPLLSRYREQMELYPNFFSSFASSIHARFATFTSLYPVRDYNAFTLERVPVKSVFEVLHENGYACSLFYSSFLDYTGFRNFLEGRGIDGVYDADTMPGERKTERVAWGLREEETLGAIQAQIKAYASEKKRFFLTYVPAAPHYPYEKVPEQFHKFKRAEMGDYSPLYYNELLYMDWVLASIVEQLEASGLLAKTVVIITNDHGEMLGEHGGPIGHGFQLSPELVNTPLIIMDPRKNGFRINPTIGSQVDLLPTMLDLLGIPIPADELYEGRSLARAGEPDGRLIYVNSMQGFGVIDKNRLMLGDRDRDKGALTSAFTIEDTGAKTVFAQDVGNPRPDISIQQFDHFQENLLRNYSLYRNSFRKSQSLTVR
jgi:arylsulfatase A-like enzyme